MRHRSMLAAAIISIAAASSAYGHGSEPHNKAKHLAPNLDMVEKNFGRTGDPKKVTKTIRIDGHDTMRFTPPMITIKQGETIRFIVRNVGKVMHEAVIGTHADLKEHGEWMKKFPGMEHDEPYMVHVAPGQSGEIVWQFTEAGDFHFACLIPGHFEAGMVGKIRVVAIDN